MTETVGAYSSTPLHVSVTGFTLTISLATTADVRDLTALRRDVALAQTARFGEGHWSAEGSEKGTLRNMLHARVLIGRDGPTLVTALRLATRKPWAIDPRYFAKARRPIYLTDMSVAPTWQRRGIGEIMMRAAADEARAWHGDAIRLDAYDAPAGAGPFYQKCGLVEVGRVSYRGVPLRYFEMKLDDG